MQRFESLLLNFVTYLRNTTIERPFQRILPLDTDVQVKL